MKRVGCLMLGLMLLAAACGDSGSGSADSSDTAAPTTVNTEATSDTTAPTEDAEDDGVETLADFIPMFGFGDDPEAAQAQFREQEKQVQERIRECMAAEGFDYVPFVPDEGAFFYGPGGDLTEEEFAEQYGFGFTTFLLDDPFEGEDAEINDPNDELVQAMDEATQEEYYRVLWGDEPDIDFESMTEEEIDAYFETYEQTGCYAEAEQEVFAYQEFDEEFGDSLNAMFEKVQSDPRIVELETAWSACMKEKGFDFATQEDIFDYLQKRQDEVVTWAEPSEADMAAMEEEFGEEGPTEEQIAEMDKLFGPQYDEAELKALNDEEIAIAVADLSCNEGRDELFEEVFEEYEAEFVAENREALEQYRDGG